MKITPNAARGLRRTLKQAAADLARTRWDYLKTDRSKIVEREDRLFEVLEARRWYWQVRRNLESAAVEVGAAWSPAALERRRNRP